MSETKHSAAPWKIGTSSCMLVGECTAIQTNDDTIALMVDFDISEEQNQANAKLIIAAPELLASLKNVIEGWGIAETSEQDEEYLREAMRLVNRIEGRQIYPK